MDLILNNWKRKQPLTRPFTPPRPEKRQSIRPAKAALRAESPPGRSAKVYCTRPPLGTPTPVARLPTRLHTAHPPPHVANPAPHLACPPRSCIPLTAARLDTVRQRDPRRLDQWVAHTKNQPIMPSPSPAQQRRRPSDALFARSEGDAPSRHSFPIESPEDWWVPRELLLYANEQRGEAQQQVAKLQRECQMREDRKVDAELGRMRAERKVALLEQRMARMEKEHQADQSYKIAEAEEGGRRQEAAKAAVQIKEMAKSAGFAEQRLAGVQARAESTKSAHKALQSQLEGLQSQLEAERATREVLEKKLAVAWLAQDQGHEHSTTARGAVNNDSRVTLSTRSRIPQPLPPTKERLPDEKKTKDLILPPTHLAKKGQLSRPQNVSNARAAKKPAREAAAKLRMSSLPQAATKTRRRRV